MKPSRPGTRSTRNPGDPDKPGWDPASLFFYTYRVGKRRRSFWPFKVKTMQIKDEGCKIADKDNKKKQFQSHSSCARLPVIHLHPKHDILFIMIPARSCRFHWRQHPRFLSDPASRHDLKSLSSKFCAWISALSLMHDCCCFLFWCPCVLSLSLSLRFSFHLYLQFSI